MVGRLPRPEPEGDRVREHERTDVCYRIAGVLLYKRRCELGAEDVFDVHILSLGGGGLDTPPSEHLGQRFVVCVLVVNGCGCDSWSAIVGVR